MAPSFLLVVALAAAPAAAPAAKKKAEATETKTLRQLSAAKPQGWKADEGTNTKVVEGMKQALPGADVEAQFFLSPDTSFALQLLYIRSAEKIPPQNHRVEIDAITKGFETDVKQRGGVIEKLDPVFANGRGTTTGLVKTGDRVQFVQMVGFVDGESRLVNYACACHALDTAKNRPVCQKVVETCAVAK